MSKKRKVRVPEYSVLEMRHESFICTERIPGGAERFRRFGSETELGWDPMAGHEAVRNLLANNRGRCTVSVDEQTGDVEIRKGDQSVVGSISKLTEYCTTQ